MLGDVLNDPFGVQKLALIVVVWVRRKGIEVKIGFVGVDSNDVFPGDLTLQV